MSRYTVATVCSIVLFSVVTSASPARAQGQLAYCKVDAERLCPGVPRGGGRLLACLKANEDNVTVGCAKELKRLKARMQQQQ
jgi:Cysteine rich repeat